MAHFSEPGTQVRGRYCGIAFEGTVLESRRHTMNAAVTLTTVSLDDEVEINGTPRTRLLLSTDWAGQPVPSYDRYCSDTIEAR